ncbi:hypothetical protein [Prosthecobacter sp.]|jgi:hypothetical protein|uniref:hypothetical protein n=1 Tax=Prosthecobacter sp. TaxID=1965333 RepID=UPI0037842DEE
MNRLLPLLTAACLLAAGAARAQYVTNLTLMKNQFLTGEPVVAQVTVINRSGADVVLGGHGGRDWLQFEITESSGRRLAPVTIGSDQAITIKAGAANKQTVEISGGYSTADLGTFNMVANVLHPITGQYYSSNKVRMTITDSKSYLFDQPFGVPDGFPNAGRARRYNIILFRELNTLLLYSRVTDEKSGAYLATLLLGPVIMVSQPQISIDAKNKLHVFFLAQPHIYCHAIVNPDGKVFKRSYYRDDDGNRPALLMAGGVGQVVGGVYFDPSAPPPEKKKMRKASERPPGL